MPIPPLPEGLEYNPDGDFAVFLGLHINPTYGRWISIDEFTDLDVLHAYAEELCRSNPESGGEYGIFSSEGYEDLLGEGPLELAVILATVLGGLNDQEREAFPVWVGHRGRRYTLYTKYDNGTRLTDADTLLESFQQDYCGTWETVKDFGEEKLEMLLDNSEVSRELREIIGNFLDAERYAEGDLNGDYYWDRTAHGVAVFWRA